MAIPEVDAVCGVPQGASGGVVEFVDHRVTYRIDAAEGLVQELRPIWKSRSKQWPSAWFDAIHVETHWYKGVHELRLALRGTDAHGAPCTVKLGLGEMDHGLITGRARSISELLSIPMVDHEGRTHQPNVQPKVQSNAAEWVSAPPSFTIDSIPPRAGNRTFIAVGRCETCESMAFSTPLTDNDESGFWAIAECPVCGTRFRYRHEGGDGHTLTMAVDDPGDFSRLQRTRVAIDHEAQRVVCAWRHGDRGGCRIRDTRRRFYVDVVPPGGGPASLAAAAGSMVVVFSGRSAKDDAEQAELHPVQGLHLFDSDTGNLLWSRPLHAEPLVRLAGGVVELNWSGSWCVPASPGHTTEYLDATSGAVAEPAAVAAFAQAVAAVERRRIAVFAEIGGVLEGEAEFERWAAVIARHLDARPVQKLSGLSHRGYEIVDFHCQNADGSVGANDGDGYQELLLVVRNGVMQHCVSLNNPQHRASLGVGANWNVTGFYIEGDWLVVERDRHTMQFFELVQQGA